jgi:hypothetical protein
MEPRLKPEIWIKALVRQLNMEMITTMVVRKGDPDGGAVYLKVNRFAEGCLVYSRSYGLDGERVWAPATGDGPVEEQQADDYIARQVNYDPDCWVIEIEDPENNFSIEKYII